jgi:two-component sensor histidine kinase
MGKKRSGKINFATQSFSAMMRERIVELSNLHNMLAKKMEAVHPFDLEHLAAAIARNYGDKGAIIITRGGDGTRVAFHGMTLREAEDALCIAIHDLVSNA